MLASFRQGGSPVALLHPGGPRCSVCHPVYKRSPHVTLPEAVPQGVPASAALSQTTKNRTIEARQSVSFRNPIFGFSLSNSTSRQSPVVCPQRTRTLLAWPIWSGHKSETSLNIRAKTDARIPRRKAERGHECLPVFISTLAWRTCVPRVMPSPCACPLGGVRKEYILWGASTSALPPIVSGRFRLLSGVDGSPPPLVSPMRVGGMSPPASTAQRLCNIGGSRYAVATSPLCWRRRTCG